MRGRGRDLLLGVAAALPVLLALLCGARGPRVVTLNLGPNDSTFLHGFLPLYEIEEPLSTHWTSYHARVGLPLVVSGDATLSFRSARILPETAQVEVSLAGRVVERFSCRGGRYEVRRVALGPQSGTPVDVGFDVDSHDRRGLGLKLDWLRLELGEGARLRLAGATAARALLFVVFWFALLRFAGFVPRAALLGTLPLALATAAAALGEPLVLAHLLQKLALSTALVGTLCAVGLRRRAHGSWATLLFLLGYLVKGVGVFHPGYYYPDVQLFRRYAQELATNEGSLAERGVAAQKRTNTAYPRQVAGKAYAFPYSPVFFVPFTWLVAEPALIEDAERHVGLAAGAAEALLALWLAGLAFGNGAGLGAMVVALLLPPMHSRLLFAMWPTLFGHVFDVLVIGAALLALARPDDGARLLRAVGLTFVALALYVSSLFNLGAFLTALALVERRRGLRLLLGYTACALLVVLWLYHPFLRALFGEILPAVLSGVRMASDEGTAPPGLLAALNRVPMFFGWGLPALSVAGFVLLRRQASEAARRTLTAYALAFLALVLLRGFGAGLFRDLKEITFVSPLVAVLAGAALEEMWRRGRSGRWATALIVVGLLAFCAERYAFYWTSYRPPSMTTLVLD